MNVNDIHRVNIYICLYINITCYKYLWENINDSHSLSHIAGEEWSDALFFDLTPQPHQNVNHLTLDM